MFLDANRNGQRDGTPRFGMPLDDFDDNPPLPGWEHRVADVLTRANPRIEYEYDFGDSWSHRIVLEAVIESDLHVSLATDDCIEPLRQVMRGAVTVTLNVVGIRSQQSRSLTGMGGQHAAVRQRSWHGCEQIQRIGVQHQGLARRERCLEQAPAPRVLPEAGSQRDDVRGFNQPAKRRIIGIHAVRHDFGSARQHRGHVFGTGADIHQTRASAQRGLGGQQGGVQLRASRGGGGDLGLQGVVFLDLPLEETLSDGGLLSDAFRRQDVGIAPLVLGSGEIPELDQAFVQ